MNGAPFWLVDTALGVDGFPVGMFEDAQGYLDARASRKAGAAAKKELQDATIRRARLEADTTSFVNPFNFVPLGSGPSKSTPSGHLALRNDLVSGSFSLTYSALTPLALSGSGSGDGETDPRGPHRLANGQTVLPGSSVTGAVRALHEALTDSCLRVIDLGYRPVHRDPAVVQAADRWRMAVATGPGEVILCEPITFGGKPYPAVWIKAQMLDPHLRVDAGQRFHVTAPVQDLTVRRDRLEAGNGVSVTRCKSSQCDEKHWRTIVSSTVGNRVRHPAGRQHPYHLPFAPEGTEDTGTPLSESVVRALAYDAKNAGDVVRARRGQRPDLRVGDVGTRQAVREELHQGDVVWARLDGVHHVERISWAVLWRTAGAYPVRERIGAYAPCDDATHLCPSCALFGMVEEREGGGEQVAATVQSYAGHVRVGMARVSEVAQGGVRLTEMSSPRPGAGQFYLENANFAGRRAANREDRPLREWGSAADRGPVPRQIRGRKRFWVSGNDGTHPKRYLAAENAHPTMTHVHALTPAGSTVTTTVHFDALTVAQLGALLVSVNPDLLRCATTWPAIAATLPPELQHHAAMHGLGLHLGAGKGIGLGAVTATVDEATMLTQGPDRYTSTTDDPGLTVSECVDRFVDTAHTSAWAQIVALSLLDWVPEQMLHYPPDDHPHNKFEFDFWKKSSGAFPAGGGPGNHALVALPDASNADPRVHRPWLGEGPT